MKPVVLAFTVLAAGFVGGGAESAAAERPNFVVIVVDDMGYSDFGCYGGEIETPRIDALAANGVRFSQFYNCSRCCQTRASLLTGAYPQRVGMSEFGRTMDLDVPTLGERLKSAGYRTGLMGKWHLSQLPERPRGNERLRWLDHQAHQDAPLAQPESLPTRRGFDEFYGIVWGVVDHFDPFSLCDGEQPIRDVPQDFYLPDAISQRSAKFVRDAAAAKQPFFLYVAYDSPHWPIQAPTQDIAKYDGKYDQGWDEIRRQRFKRQVEMGLFDEQVPLGEVITNGPIWRRTTSERQQYLADKMEVHAAMVDRIDQGVGKIVDSLRDTGALNNTVVFIFSDNGASFEIPGGPGYDRNAGTRDGRPALRENDLQLPEHQPKLGSAQSYTGIGPGWASASNTPLRFWKTESYEGGCRTPLVVHWPAGLKREPGAFVRDVGHVIDIMPTCLDLAGVDPLDDFRMDGATLRPALEGAKLAGDRSLYFMHVRGRGVLRGQFKASKLENRGWELFDIDGDPGETHDISGDKPEVLNSMVRDLMTWRKGVNSERQNRGTPTTTAYRPAAAASGEQGLGN